MESLAAERIIVRYDEEAFENWYVELVDKASMRMDLEASRFLWERGYGIMDALVKIVHN